MVNTEKVRLGGGGKHGKINSKGKKEKGNKIDGPAKQKQKSMAKEQLRG